MAEVTQGYKYFTAYALVPLDITTDLNDDPVVTP